MTSDVYKVKIPSFTTIIDIIQHTHIVKFVLYYVDITRGLSEVNQQTTNTITYIW